MIYETEFRGVSSKDLKTGLPSCKLKLSVDQRANPLWTVSTYSKIVTRFNLKLLHIMLPISKNLIFFFLPIYHFK
ncbi:hypothetical protein HanIR_Chr02g0060091 [Helianthus annuus]|nr:hypothetical protein HanIR_Chr02g0060091 [Helianthus annuus]